MKIIDAHCHIHIPDWVVNNNSKDFLSEKFNEVFSEKKIMENMRLSGISKAVVFPLPSTEINLKAANLYTLYISKLYPEKFIPFTIIDEHPEKWFKFGVKGFKEHTFGQRIQKDKNGNDIFSQQFKKTYKFMEKNNLPLLLHAGINRIERIKNDILKNAPNLKIILAHLGADYPINKRQIIQVLTGLKDKKNIYYDISTINDILIIEKAMEIVSIDKLIFGSDFPYEKPAESLNRIAELSLTDIQKEKIYYKNILKAIEGY